eukprot:s123_g50.t3
MLPASAAEVPLALARQVRANVITFNASISACEKGREWPAALCMLEAMRGGATVQDQISFSAAVSACEKTGEWRRVLQVVSSMQTTTSPNEIVYNAAIGACEKGPIPAFFDGFHRYTESSSLCLQCFHFLPFFFRLIWQYQAYNMFAGCGWGRPAGGQALTALKR